MIGDVILARFNARFDGEPVMNSLAFVSVGFDEPGFDAMANQLHIELAAALGLDGGAGGWIDGLSVQYNLVSMQYQDVVPGTAPMVEIAVGQPGTVADEDAMPPNDSLTLTLRSAFKGQGGRGRIFLTGFAEGSANGGYWEAGAQDYASAIGSALLTNFGEEGSGNFRLVVLHRYSNGGVRGAPSVKLEVPEQKPVMSFTVRNNVTSIGRRAVGRRIRRVRAAP